LTPQSSRLFAISRGLSAKVTDDEMLGHGLILYDAFSPWSARLQSEAHNRRAEGYGDAT